MVESIIFHTICQPSFPKTQTSKNNSLTWTIFAVLYQVIKKTGKGEIIVENTDLKNITTVGDLTLYLHTHPSPVVSDILNKAITFFGVECRSSEGKMDWNAIKERKKLGLKFQLKEETVITPEICLALNLWIIKYGRNLGTSLTEVMLSQRMGGIDKPQMEVTRILNELIKR